jgi:polyphosphate kinase
MKKIKKTYFNREISWLSFNQRVLDQASDQRHPLLERVKFLAISASNLDEFFRVRVGGLMLIADDHSQLDIAGLTPQEQLRDIRGRVRDMVETQSRVSVQLESELQKHDIVRVLPSEVTPAQRQLLLDRFRAETLAAVTPTAAENTNRLSVLRIGRLSVCVRLKNDAATTLSPIDATGESIFEMTPDHDAGPRNCRYVLLALGKSQERFWSLPSKAGHRYILLEDVVQMFLSEYFDSDSILESSTIRITRNGDVQLAEDGRADLLADMQQMLEARKNSDCVRLELSATASQQMRHFLESTINVDAEDVYLAEGPLSLSDYFSLAGINGFGEIKDKPWHPQAAIFGKEGDNFFDTIAGGDQLLYHPYQSYRPVIDFLTLAAEDPNVIAIKQTLYRTAKDSSVAQALATAAANGKNVTAIVELKARFDEARNIYWARELENAGVDVIYGIRGLKTHAKMCLVVRKEPTGIRRYIHFGTGNYNEATARLYSDVSLFTCDEQLGSDAVHFFNAITGLSVPQPLEKLAAAPINLREKILELIRGEIANAQNGGAAQITAKVNSLTDKQIIDALYEASEAGVKVRLNIRGICCLVPGKKGLSENIRVVSVVDRLLEHARVFRFKHGGDELVFMSSADWMSRNLNRRVELMIPVTDSDCRNRLSQILDCYFNDNVAATELMPDGSYVPVKKKKKAAFRAQQFLQHEAEQIATASNPTGTVFQTHRKTTT